MEGVFLEQHSCFHSLSYFEMHDILADPAQDLYLLSLAYARDGVSEYQLRHEFNDVLAVLMLYLYTPMDYFTGRRENLVLRSPGGENNKHVSSLYHMRLAQLLNRGDLLCVYEVAQYLYRLPTSEYDIFWERKLIYATVDVKATYLEFRHKWDKPMGTRIPIRQAGYFGTSQAEIMVDELSAKTHIYQVPELEVD